MITVIEINKKKKEEKQSKEGRKEGRCKERIGKMISSNIDKYLIDNSIHVFHDPYLQYCT